ncbi:MAG: nucleotidyltransferase domain-containing protein [Lentisphaerae bacterium]|nr:nucleotidyltransferase domain-containing protein [Lentisphaerota bacterium]
MISIKHIRQYAEAIGQRFNPDRVVLFGSYAEGNPAKDSDVDLLVVMPHEGRDVEQAFEIRRTIPRRFPLDLVVRTPDGLQRRLRQNDTFLTSIWRTGKTLYERRA